MSLYEYLISGGFNNKKDSREYRSTLSNVAVHTQEMCNYVEDKYGNDRHLKEWRDMIWDELL